MPVLFTRFAKPLLIALPLIGGTVASAEDERWFRVELMVFAHEAAAAATTGNAMAEQWDPTPALAYPGAARFLVDPELVAANQAQSNANSVVDEFGRQILSTSAPQVEGEVLIEESPPAAAGQTSAAGGSTSNDALRLPATDNVEPEAEAEQPLLRPTPFVALSLEQQEFAAMAAAMQRRQRYSVLFHETWVQPVADAASALPIILDRSGDSLHWPRLQGSIRLHLSRYLHLETNLWLNTRGYYLPGTWRMPQPPLGPPSLIIEEAPTLEPEDAVPDWPYPQQEPLQAPDIETGEQDMLEEIGPQYPYRHAVLLQQKRRMRSTETHYLDHPLFGVIIKLLPLSEEELTELALAEQTAEQAAGEPAQLP